MYVDDVGGARIGTTIGKSMARFAATAYEGGFAVSDEGGKALLKAITEMATWVEDELANLRLLEQEPKLGSSNGANVMKPYVRQVASDHQGFLVQLVQFRESLAQAEEGITAAMRNYDFTDLQEASRLT